MRWKRRERIQALWGGVGELVRVELEDGRTAVVKSARPPAGDRSVSTLRKRRSFDVELAFYRGIAARCDDTCRVPALLEGSGSDAEGQWVIVLEDLDAAGFPARVGEAQGRALDAILGWLAHFHARFVGERVAELWPQGNYWHLDTRRDELPAIRDARIRDTAEQYAAPLRAARFQTIIHGDPKEANFCFDRAGTRVAAVDFQYVGHGCGITDVAYLLYDRADAPADGIDRARLATYFAVLDQALADRPGPALDRAALITEWNALYPVARADFRRFLAGWRPARPML